MASIHPDVEALIAAGRAVGAKPFEALTPLEARAAYAARRDVMQWPAEKVSEKRDFTVAGPAGPIPLRLYRPADAPAEAVLACVVYMHGGGWVFGNLESHDALCCRLANGSGACVIAIDYRLAPEHRFPAAIDDCAAAYRAIAEDAKALRIDPSRFAVAGDSAGGNLAAILALMGRDGIVPRPVFQALIYPAVNLDQTLASYGPKTDGMVISGVTMVYFLDHYIPSGTDRADWRASPIKASSHEGLPAAFVMTCGHDPLAAEGRAYAALLEKAGVRVAALHLADQTHGMLTMTKVIGMAAGLQDYVAATLRDALAPRGPGGL